MSETYNFQEMIQALHKFWGDQGALIWHPYYSQVGAGTMNPSTFLRVLGPEPFNVAYMEPSVRPDDGRYGENPNRLQTFYQYQVILKPDPGNAQEVYLDSLRAIGIDPHQHDIRFVEDNWESPALGAWGLGWEVWLDGLEITQFTYFQQTGQIDLSPVSVEITYGLDRIAAPLQGVRNFKDIQWNAKRTFGDMNMQAEKEQSQYYFEIANVERNHKMYNLHAEEVQSALDAGLVLPAYDNLLRLSHIFNILDTRGAIGVTERADYFRRMRGLARDVAKLYVESREQQEYPWLDESDETGGAISGHDLPDLNAAIEIATPSKAADMLLEIGTEELPPADLDNYLAQLENAIPTMLNKLRLEHGTVKVVGTPRRLVIHVENVAASQPDKEEMAKGPPADRAFASDGEPTKAAEGFARGKGVDVKDLKIEEIDGGRYVVAKVFEKGRGAIEVLAEALPGLIANLKVDRAIRWNNSGVTFSRPIRWLAGAFGDDAIPYQYANLTAGKHSRGLRFGAQERFEFKNAADYFKRIETEGIILDVETRRTEIWQQVQALAKSVSGDVAENPGLLAEVTHLVEAPTALTGEFEAQYLELPREVLVSVMRKHQRYFPVEKDGELLPYFITVSNGPTKEREIVSAGNAAVVRARFADAAFFVSNDRKLKLDDYVAQLDTLTFQKKLGSMLDKTQRIVPLTEELAGTLGLSAAETATAKRAAELAKADLMTSMVVEMTSLQGVMGQKYAIESGENADVGLAIKEHYLPTGAGGAAPSSKAGLTVGLADRLDSLAGLFAAGLAPTGSKDPFALRRAALGVIQNLIAWDKDFDLTAGLQAAAERLPIDASVEQMAEAFEFIKGRMRVVLLDEGYKYDVVDAVLSVQANNPASAARAAKALSEFVAREDWDQILPAYSRCVRITRSKKETFTVKPEAFSEDAEKALFAALETAEGTTRAAGSAEDFFNAFLPMMPAITKFFDDVLVMSENEQEQANRLGMLQRIAALADGVADLSHLEGF